MSKVAKPSGPASRKGGFRRLVGRRVMPAQLGRALGRRTAENGKPVEVVEVDGDVIEPQYMGEYKPAGRPVPKRREAAVRYVRHLIGETTREWLKRTALDNKKTATKQCAGHDYRPRWLQDTDYLGLPGVGADGRRIGRHLEGVPYHTNRALRRRGVHGHRITGRLADRRKTPSPLFVAIAADWLLANREWLKAVEATTHNDLGREVTP